MKKIISFIVVVRLVFISFVENAQCQGNEMKQNNFLRKNAHSINITGNSDYSDLKILDKVVKGKKIILLGEFTHGSKEINLLKNRIIAYLHQKYSFNVLLLESGIGEIYSTNFSRDSLSNRQMLNAGLVGPWRTLEYLELMDYLKERKRLKVAGFDVQKSGRTFSSVLESVLNTFDKEKNLIADVETRNIEIVSKFENRKTPIDAAITQEKEKLVADYQEIIKGIEDNQKRLQTSGWSSEKLEIIKRTIENRVEYLNYYQQFRTDSDFRKRFSRRDSTMAENILWFASQIYPNEKIIVSAHNYHIAKYNEKELVMGKILAEKFGKEIYSIGIFGGRGEISNNAGKTESMISPTEENDVQNVINQINNAASFLRIPTKQKPETKWLFEDIVINNSFVNLDSDNKLVLQKSFDGLIFIHKISPSQSLN